MKFKLGVVMTVDKQHWFSIAHFEIKDRFTSRHYKWACFIEGYTKKKNTLVSGSAGDKKNLHPGGSNLFIFINLIEFCNWSLHLRTTLAALFFVEKQGVLPFIFRREKKVDSPK